MKSDRALLLKISYFTCILAFIVIVLGAYTRLSHSGLGCPDWPGCYGKMIVLDDVDYINQAKLIYPDMPLKQDKAWTEMIHRYVAGILGLFILLISILTWRKTDMTSLRVLASGLVLLVVFQSMLGMWTVTLLLQPVVVVLHLLGGMTILSLLYFLALKLHPTPTEIRNTSQLRPWAIAGLTVLALQILSGGWVSANYAALACPDFPTCQNSFLPEVDFKAGFTLSHDTNVNYEGGVLDSAARTAIHLTHRLGALITLLTLLAVALRAICTQVSVIRFTGIAVLVLLLVQVSLGISNVIMNLPLLVAVAHNAVAALLLLSLVTLLHWSLVR